MAEETIEDGTITRVHCWYGSGSGNSEDDDPVAFSIRNALSAIASFFHHNVPRTRRGGTVAAAAAALYDRGGRLVATYQIGSPLRPFPRALPLPVPVGWYGQRGDDYKFTGSQKMLAVKLEEKDGKGNAHLLVTRGDGDNEEKKTTVSPPLPDGWIRVLSGLSGVLPVPVEEPVSRCDLVGMLGGGGTSSSSSSLSSLSSCPKYFYPIEVGDAVGATVEEPQEGLPGRAVGDREKIVCGIKALAALAGSGSQLKLGGSSKELWVFISSPIQQSASLTLTLPLVSSPAPRPLPRPPRPPRPSSPPLPSAIEEKEATTKKDKDKDKKTPTTTISSFARGENVKQRQQRPPLVTADDNDAYTCRARYYLDAKKGRRQRSRGDSHGNGLHLLQQGGTATAAAAVLPVPSLVAIYHPKESVRSAAAVAAEDRGCTPLTLSTYAETRRLILSGGTRGLVAVLADAESLPRLRRSVEKAGLASIIRVAAIPPMGGVVTAAKGGKGGEEEEDISSSPPLLPSFACAVSDALGFSRRSIRRILVASHDADVLGEMLDRALALSSSHPSSSPVAVITHQPRDMEVMPSAIVASEYDLIFSELPEDPITGEKQCRERGMEFARRVRLLAKSPTDAPVLVAIIDRQWQDQTVLHSSSSSDEGGDGGASSPPLTAMFDYVLHRPFDLGRVRSVVLSAERALLRRNPPQQRR